VYTTKKRPWKNHKLTNFLQFLRKLSPQGQRKIRNLDIQVSVGKTGTSMSFWQRTACGTWLRNEVKIEIRFGLLKPSARKPQGVKITGCTIVWGGVLVHSHDSYELCKKG
jgi:hypothetical protein